ncbi:hypothetical protein OPQ81_005560 [Rhizoctonia solani]|nr:hypothetical protein OPQ81_005560 [Rhizoctonia solani]
MEYDVTIDSVGRHTCCQTVCPPLSGHFRPSPFLVVKPLNTEKCTDIEELKACEKLVIHPSGLVYLACTPSPESRIDWMPSLFNLNSSALRGRASTDYVATYDPSSHLVTRLDMVGMKDPRGLNVHGLDIVADEIDPDILWMYLVNHRPPLDPLADARRIGADPVIEVFKTRLGSNTIEWIRTFEYSSLIVSPNDVVGGSDGKEVWFTNDRRAKTGQVRALVEGLFRVKSTSVRYCHSDRGCKIAADELYGSNGLARTQDGRFWVASTFGGYITVHERQADNSLAPTEVIQVGFPIDNLAVSPDGSVIAATLPKMIDLMKAAHNTSLTAPSSAHRISLNTGRESYFGEKYKVQKIYEDNGDLGSSATSAALHGDYLYLHGLMAHRLRVCIIYQVYVSPLMTRGGWYREVETLNTEHCTAIEELKACEKLVIHPSGVVYLACAPSPESRLAWMPAIQHFNSSHLEITPSEDYVATYDTRSQKITKLSVTGFVDPRKLNVHGMDVVPDEHNPDLLWVYLVNHRPSLSRTPKGGADSAIEVFKTHLGSSQMEWVRTFVHPEIIKTPNDVMGGPNGKEAWFTNDYPVKQGSKRELHVYFQLGSTWVGYCHAENGCKVAADELYTSNGIVRTHDGKVWVASLMGGYLTVHEQQADKTLVQTEVIQLGSFVDNISVAPDGSVIAATFPKADSVLKSFKDTKLTSPSSAHRISINKGEGSYYGEKYKVQKIYEDDGAMGSSATSAAVYDGSVYLNGLMSHRLQICKIPSQMLQ